MATVMIGADICPIGDNVPLLQAGNKQALYHDLIPEMEKADLRLANLECPFITAPSPIRKTGPVFGASNDCINGIVAGGINVLCLANNHIMDHGEAGLRNTLQTCARAGISTVGAGENLAAARRMLIQRVAGVRVAILAMAEHEFSIATPNSWGANPLDVIDYVRNVRERRSEFDYLIVLFHGGDEFLVPSPRVQDTCRFLVEMGANAVIVQHPHDLGGYENYRGGHIVYGQGALIMDEGIYRNRESFHEGYLVRLTIASDFKSEMEIVPFGQSDPTPGARRLSGAREQRFREGLAKKCEQVLDDAFVLTQWLEFCERTKHGYLSALLGHNRILRKLNARGLMTRSLYGKQQLLSVRNLVCCETHREAVETIFNHKLFRF